MFFIVFILMFLFNLNCKKNQKSDIETNQSRDIRERISISRTVLDSLPENDALAKLKTRLNLTDKQIETIWPIMKDSREQMQAHFELHGKDRAKIRQLANEELIKLDTEIEKNITYDQYLEYQKYKADRIERAKQIMKKQDLSVKKAK